MDNKIKKECKGLPNEKTKPPLGKSFSYIPAALNSFAQKFKRVNEAQQLTTVSYNKDSLQLLSKEQEGTPIAIGRSPLVALDKLATKANSSNKTWTIKIFLN